MNQFGKFLTDNSNQLLSKVLVVVILIVAVGLWIEATLGSQKSWYVVAAFFTVFGLWRVYALFFAKRV